MPELEQMVRRDPRAVRGPGQGTPINNPDAVRAAIAQQYGMPPNQIPDQAVAQYQAQLEQQMDGQGSMAPKKSYLRRAVQPVINLVESAKKYVSSKLSYN